MRVNKRNYEQTNNSNKKHFALVTACEISMQLACVNQYKVASSSNMISMSSNQYKIQRLKNTEFTNNKKRISGVLLTNNYWLACRAEWNWVTHQPQIMWVWLVDMPIFSSCQCQTIDFITFYIVGSLNRDLLFANGTNIKAFCIDKLVDPAMIHFRRWVRINPPACMMKWRLNCRLVFHDVYFSINMLKILINKLTKPLSTLTRNKWTVQFKHDDNPVLA